MKPTRLFSVLATSALALGMAVAPAPAARAATSDETSYSIRVQLQKPTGELLKNEIRIQDGEQGSLELGDAKVEFIPSHTEGRKIIVNTKIYQLRDGKYVLSANPEILTKLNHQASVTEVNETGEAQYTIRFVPTEMPSLFTTEEP